MIYDEGMLNVCCKMRGDGKLPPETTFKISALFSITNPSALKFWTTKMGLVQCDSVNPVRDLTLPIIAAIREVTDQPLDIHIFWRTSIARTLDAPEIVRIASPVYFKNARSGPDVTFEECFLQSMRIAQIIEKHYPDAKQSKPGAKDLRIPAEPGTKW